VSNSIARRAAALKDVEEIVDILNSSGISTVIVDEVKSLLSLRKRSVEGFVEGELVDLLTSSGVEETVVDEIKSVLGLSKRSIADLD
jgi:hypothetical protein